MVYSSNKNLTLGDRGDTGFPGAVGPPGHQGMMVTVFFSSPRHAFRTRT